MDLGLRKIFGSSPRVRGTRSPCRPAGGRQAVHPRVYGELGTTVQPDKAITGSSPRVRGTLDNDVCSVAHSRFIPACTGNSSGTVTCYNPYAVHPRVYGELLDCGHCPVFAVGSSPRVRGTLCPSPARLKRRRFIPACTGNSSSIRSISPMASVHPRVYGELRPVLLPPLDEAGSSPRVRGTLWTDLTTWVHARFIPACTGNSAIFLGHIELLAVHPRVYGELAINLGETLTTDGSSPRVRGTPRHENRRAASLRFIPACTGNSIAGPCRRRQCRFIPACTGNSATHAYHGLNLVGSSPRVRGTPAEAPGAARRTSVHPRVYGELSLEDMLRLLAYGSSPRVRGTRFAARSAAAR